MQGKLSMCRMHNYGRVTNSSAQYEHLRGIAEEKEAAFFQCCFLFFFSIYTADTI